MEDVHELHCLPKDGSEKSQGLQDKWDLFPRLRHWGETFHASVVWLQASLPSVVVLVDNLR